MIALKLMTVVKGYVVPSGYMGYVGNNNYRLFSTEEEYLEYISSDKVIDDYFQEESGE